MKHKKEVDEYFRNPARYEQDEAHQEYIAELAWIIEPGVQRDIKEKIPLHKNQTLLHNC